MRSCILILFLSMSLPGCSHDPANYTFDKQAEEAVILRNWRIVGPFTTASTENALEVDHLNPYGYSEAAAAYGVLKKISLPATVPNGINKVIESGSPRLDFNKILGYSDDQSVSGVVYAGCNIMSSSDQQLKLNFASNNGAKVWINQKLIFSKDLADDINPYENYIDIHLRPGNNFLLTKVENKTKSWGMFAAIERPSKEGQARHRKNFELRYGNAYLARNIIENDTIKLAWGMPKDEYKLQVKGAVTISFKIRPDQSINIATLPDGLYTTNLYRGNSVFSSYFYKGNATLHIKKLLKKASASPRYTNDSILSALKYRYNVLIMPGNMPKADYAKHSWDKRVLFVLKNLLLQMNILDKRSDPRDVTGSLLKAYRSKIDSGMQYYILHVPSAYKKGEPLPLVIEMSKLMKRFTSPLETNRFANISLIEHFDDLANKYNMLIVEPGNRTTDQSNYNGIDEADLWEALEDVRSIYSIDTGRIYLRGACRASYDALRLAIRHPDKFTAISTVSPEFVPVQNGTYNIRQEQNNPLNFLKNIKDHPFYNIHSRLDTHSPVLASERLRKLARQAGLSNFIYRELPLELKPYYSEEYLDDIFGFFSRCLPGAAPSSLHFSTSQVKYNKSYWLTINTINAGVKAIISADLKHNTLTVRHQNVLSYTVDLSKAPFDREVPLTLIDNGKRLFSTTTDQDQLNIRSKKLKGGITYKNSKIEGPFEHIFTNSFIVVPGTAGGDRHTTSINNVLNILNDDWKTRYYNSFVVKPDVDISENDMRHSNLLLIGSPLSNLVLKHLAGKLPLQITDDFITIGSKQFSGGKLSYYFIYPNPLNHQKYIAVIGYNNPGYFQLLAERDQFTPFNDISDFGWYDFSVWSDRKKIQSGYFDYKWQ